MGCWAILTVGTSAGRDALPRVRSSVGMRSRASMISVGTGSCRSGSERTRRSACLPSRTDEGGPVRRSRGWSGGRPNRLTGEGGFSLVETSITLFLLMAIAAFGLQTMTSAWMLENSSIVQSMTDAQAAIETAYAQRWVFAAIPSSDLEANPDPTKTNLYTLWPLYPASNSTVVNIGQTPAKTITATVVRTRHQSTDPVAGDALSYLLESYVTYKDGLRQYCKVSKVYRQEKVVIPSVTQ
jgi:hypothetical protein